MKALKKFVHTLFSYMRFKLLMTFVVAMALEVIVDFCDGNHFKLLLLQKETSELSRNLVCVVERRIVTKIIGNYCKVYFESLPHQVVIAQLTSQSVLVPLLNKKIKSCGLLNRRLAKKPTKKPTRNRSTKPPTFLPTLPPSRSPALRPSTTPTLFPSRNPTLQPSISPITSRPSNKPTTSLPSRKPTTSIPSVQQTPKKTLNFTAPTVSPSSRSPSLSPTQPIVSSQMNLTPLVVLYLLPGLIVALLIEFQRKQPSQSERPSRLERFTIFVCLCLFAMPYLVVWFVFVKTWLNVSNKEESHVPWLPSRYHTELMELLPCEN